MTECRIRCCVLLVTAFMLEASVAASQVAAGEVSIRIVGNGANARYIAEGATQQEPVEVVIGDSVTWINEGNRTHTATAETEDGSLLFDTGDIPPGGVSSDPQQMTKEIFAKLAGEPGGSVTISYFCDHHSGMRSSLVLRDAEMSRPGVAGRLRVDDARDESHVALTRVRRDITSLTTAELNQYRDAWRRIQSNGQYHRVAGHHGCPDRYCHRPGEAILFLAWHREYVLGMENALGMPLHYWDWTASAAASTGVPRAFTDSTYRSADGVTYANPLRSFRFSCPAGAPSQATFRSPRNPAFLTQYASEVRNAYRSRSYRTVNAALESPPHNNVHGWVGGRMSSTTYAAYDPIFWAHHANVDRQWASWQRSGGPDPTASESSLPLTGFSGRTINDVRSIAALNYGYDRYDSVPTPFAQFVDNQATDEPNAEGGVGKSFDIVGPAADQFVGERQLDLFVQGIPEHPRESYFVYVFVNKPDATLEEALPENPNFAGTFAVFGGDHVEEGPHDAELRQPEAKRVLKLFEGQENRVQGPIRKVTLITTDESGSIVSREDVPFDDVSLRSARGDREGDVHDDATSAELNQRVAGGRIFTGVSNKESYDEAYRAAADQAETALSSSGADQLIKIDVVSVSGERGGISGARRLKVTIRARLE